MEHLVIDSCVIIAYLVESDSHHQMALTYVGGLEDGEYAFHAPMLVPVEVAATLSRRDPLPNRTAVIARWQRTVSDWEQTGKLALHPLDRERMHSSVNVAQQHRLKGADSVMAALADEMGLSLKTFDTDILAKFHQASL